MHPALKKQLPGIIFTLVTAVAELLFLVRLITTKLVPAKFIILIAVFLVLMAVLVYFLTRNMRRAGRFITGSAVAGVVIIILAAVSSYINQGVNTLDQITETTVEIAEVAVYVRADDPITDISGAADYTFGILKDMDRENTDKTVTQITEAVGKNITTREYVGLNELVDSLLASGDSGAIIINRAFLGLLEETEGYETAESQMRELHKEKVETVIERIVSNKSGGNNTAEADDTGDYSPSDTVFSVYISGIDSRGGLSVVSRSDVNIIATVNTETKQVLLVSTPRDYYVPLSISNGVPDKLTHAGIYGIDVCMDTLEMLYGITLDYYFRVNFSGFQTIIDALDGVTVNSEVAFSVDNYSYVVGDNELDGAAALAFARERKSFASGDRQRGKNQMAVIKAVIDKALSPTLLTNYTSILKGVEGSFEASMPYDVLAELVRDQLDSGASWNIVSYSADGSGSSQRCYSLSTNASVIIPDTSTVEHAVELMNQVKNGEIITQEQ